MFGRLFSRNKLNAPVDLGDLVTDMHSHLIPGIDDGSPDMQTSIELIRKMQEMGYKKLITTPHISSDLFKNNAAIIEAGLQKVREAIARENIDIELVAAAEYLIDDGFEILLAENRLSTLSEKYLLIELPYFHLPPNLYEITFELQIKGYKIVLAHPERYLYWYHDFVKYEELKNRGIYFQLNILSLTGHYSPESKKLAQKMIDAEMIDFLGSDLHNKYYLEMLEKSRYEPYLEKALKSGRIINHLL
jgi:protein-tyrosine phosphatase